MCHDEIDENVDSECVKLFNSKDCSSDKYLNSFLSSRGAKYFKNTNVDNCENFARWKVQTDFNFGFTLLGVFVLPDSDTVCPMITSLVEIG